MFQGHQSASPALIIGGLPHINAYVNGTALIHDACWDMRNADQSNRKRTGPISQHIKDTGSTLTCSAATLYEQQAIVLQLPIILNHPLKSH